MSNEEISFRIRKVNDLMNRFMIGNKIDPLEYNFEQYFTDYTKKEHIAVLEKIPSIDESFFLGVTVKSLKSLAIFINPQVYSLRKNFSKCHELNHCLFDMDHRLINQSFFNTEGTSTFYNEDEMMMETLADAGASVMLVPDIAVIRLLETRMSFYTMAEKFTISKTAFYNRMVQFMVFTVGLQYDHAVHLIKRFQSTGDRDGINRMLSGWGSNVKKQIILDYENSF